MVMIKNSSCQTMNGLGIVLGGRVKAISRTTSSNSRMIQSNDSSEKRSPSSRLPVNPRRQKVAPDQRKRVATACNNCNVRRIKCSGEKPCKQCASSSRDCVYPPPNEKVSISRAELDELKRKLDVYERLVQDANPDPARRGELFQSLASGPAYTASPTVSASSPGSASTLAATSLSGQFSPVIRGKGIKRASTGDSRQTESHDDAAVLMEGRVLRDVRGVAARYLGETSEAVFLDHIKDLLSSSTGTGFLLTPEEVHLFSSGSYRTLDSLPPSGASATENSPLWLPTPPNMTAMLSALRCILQDAVTPGVDSPSSSSGGIYYLSDLSSLPVFQLPTGPSDPDLNDYRQLAFFHAAFALTCQVTNAKSSPNTPDIPISETFFARAQAIIGNPLDVGRVTSLADASTLAMMGFFLAETNQLESARVHITAALRICEMLGVHVGYADERGKRIFWTVYVLDRWISVLLGRPVSMSDESIKIDLPVGGELLPAPEGLFAHIELARIAGQMTTTPAKSRSEVEGVLWTLKRWISSLPPNLQLEDGVSRDAAVCILHMRHNHLALLATRSPLLAAVRRILGERLANPSTPISSSSGTPQMHHVRTCIAAARRTIQLSKHTLSLTRRKFLRPELSQLYTAALVILLGEFLAEEKDDEQDNEEDDDEADEDDGGDTLGWQQGRIDLDTDAEMVEFAVEVFARVASTGDKYGSDCGEVLKGLQNIFRRIRLEDDGGAAPGVGGFIRGDDSGNLFAGDVNMEMWMSDTWPPYEGF